MKGGIADTVPGEMYMDCACGGELERVAGVTVHCHDQRLSARAQIKRAGWSDRKSSSDICSSSNAWGGQIRTGDGGAIRANREPTCNHGDDDKDGGEEATENQERCYHNNASTTNDISTTRRRVSVTIGYIIDEIALPAESRNTYRAAALSVVEAHRLLHFDAGINGNDFVSYHTMIEERFRMTISCCLLATETEVVPRRRSVRGCCCGVRKYMRPQHLWEVASRYPGGRSSTRPNHSCLMK